jgi:nicotinate phosphoribosyltransferase
LLLDLYELTMAQSYFDRRMDAPATFNLFARHLPRDWGFFLAAGLADALDYLEALRFGEPDLAYLESTRLFAKEFLAYLGELRFSGSMRALPEGTVFFPDEPVLEVTAPLIEAQVVETAILNQVHFQTIVASKAARCVLAAEGRRLVEFGARRAHGADAALKAARATYLAGFASTSNVLAGQRYDIPIAGTMAHSYVQAFPDELAAFRAYARTFPDACLLLVDTYDTREGARRAATVGGELAARGHRLRGVRLDSGDLIGLSVEVRGILDAAGLKDAIIFASGSVDEHLIAEAMARRAPIDAFGVGTRIAVAADAPYLDMAYKLVAYEGRPVMKLSTGKATWPGPKQVWRTTRPDGTIEDRVARADEPGPAGATPLLTDAMTDGRRLVREPLTDPRERARRALADLPAAARRLTAPEVPPVRFSAPLRQLRDDVARHVQAETFDQPPSLVGEDRA